MSVMSYQQQTTVGATGIELVIALYDGAIRGLYRAKQAVREDDTIGRRLAVKKVVDILMYLQDRLRAQCARCLGSCGEGSGDGPGASARTAHP